MFKQLAIKDFSINPFSIKDEWMLITSEKDGIINTMTASWGGFGVMWNQSVVYVVIRPQRYTKEFVDYSGKFSLSFFDKMYQKDLAYLGKVSGRDEDKINNTSLSCIDLDGFATFAEAHTVITAESLYCQPMNERSFLQNDNIEQFYAQKDFHFLYIAKVMNIYKK